MGEFNQQTEPGAEPPRETSGRTPDWNVPKPEKLPKPTYAPAIMSLGIVFLFWGIISTWIFSAVGIILIAIALVGWIGAIRNE